MNEKWNTRFAKLEPWIAKDPESPMRQVVAHLMVRAKEDFENICKEEKEAEKKKRRAREKILKM